MPFCENCGNKVSETSKFCGSCGEKIDKISEIYEIQSDKTDSHWSLEKFLEEHSPNEKGIITCPRCLGKGNVDNADIKRLSMEHSWMSGWCLYCNGSGSVNVNKITEVSIIGLIPEPSLYELLWYKSNDINFDDEGQAVAELDGKWGVINSKFEWVLKPEYEELGDWETGRYFDEKDYLVARNDNKWGFINRRGEWIVQPLFEILGEYDKEDYCQALLDNKFGWIDRNGNWLIEPIFDFFDGDNWRIDFDKYDYGRVCYEGKFGFIDRKGNWKILPKFDLLEEYDDINYCLAKSESKYGFIDRLGKWKVPPKFDLIGRYDDLNYCHAKFESKYGFIDRYGNWIIEPIFDAVGYFDKHGYAMAVNGWDSGFIDRKGVLQIHPDVENNFINSKYDLKYFDRGSSEGDRIVSNLFDIGLNSFNYNDKYLFNASYLKNEPEPKASFGDFDTSPIAGLRRLFRSSKILFDFEIEESCEILVFYRESQKTRDGFAIFTQDHSIFLWFRGKPGDKVFRLFNIEFVWLDNIDSVSNIEFKSFLHSKRQSSLEFIENKIQPLFSNYTRLFRKKITKDLQNLLFFTDIEIVSEGWDKFSKPSLNANDGAGIR
jgi:hypothetical protein